MQISYKYGCLSGKTIFFSGLQGDNKYSFVAVIAYSVYDVQMTEFGNHLVRLREAAGWTQQRLAQELGYRRYQTIHEFEAGKRPVPREVRARVSHLLDVYGRIEAPAVRERDLLCREIASFSRLLNMSSLREFHRVMRLAALRDQAALAPDVSAPDAEAAVDAVLGRASGAQAPKPASEESRSDTA